MFCCHPCSGSPVLAQHPTPAAPWQWLTRFMAPLMQNVVGTLQVRRASLSRVDRQTLLDCKAHFAHSCIHWFLWCVRSQLIQLNSWGGLGPVPDRWVPWSRSSSAYTRQGQAGGRHSIAVCCGCQCRGRLFSRKGRCSAVCEDRLDIWHLRFYNKCQPRTLTSDTESEVLDYPQGKRHHELVYTLP